MELYDRYGNVVDTTLFDIEDIPLVEKYKWYLSPRKKENYTDYVGCGGSTSTERYLLHRLIMGDYDTYEDTDHKNGNGLDNRRCNLRQCNASQNLLNRTKQIDSLLGFKNITYRKAGDKYIIQIVITDEKTKIRNQCASLQEAIHYRDAIYRRFLININLFRDEVDTKEVFSYDYDEINNKIFIHDNGKESIVYGFLFDLIIHKNPEIYIHEKYTPVSIYKFKKLLDIAERPYFDWIMINDYIENDPLSGNNLGNTLDLVNKFRISSQRKSIWIYSGYTWEQIIGIEHENQFKDLENGYCKLTERAKIVMNCDVLVDGQYIDSQRDISLAYCGSSNQRLIDIQQSLQKGEIVLWQT